MLTQLRRWWRRWWPRNRPRIVTEEAARRDDARDRWQAKQALAAPGRYYGDDGTIHHSTDLGVETHHGTVVAVWFRCQPLPFHQSECGAERAAEMERMYGPFGAQRSIPRLTGVEVVDQPRETTHAR